MLGLRFCGGELNAVAVYLDDEVVVAAKCFVRYVLLVLALRLNALLPKH